MNGYFLIHLSLDRSEFYQFEHYDYHIIEGGVLNITHYPNGYEESDGQFRYRVGGQRFLSLSPHGGYIRVEAVR